MIPIQNGLFVGTQRDCRTGDTGWAVVHACKNPCHARAVGYSGNLSPSHPNYLVRERGDDLFLNMIDPAAPLFRPEVFAAFLVFAERKTSGGKKLLIHCNQGESRAPSLALVFLAKVAGAISDDSYLSARQDFERIFAGYRPGHGIQTYLRQNWTALGAL